jgi:hypothetical protein
VVDGSSCHFVERLGNEGQLLQIGQVKKSSDSVPNERLLARQLHLEQLQDDLVVSEGRNREEKTRVMTQIEAALHLLFFRSETCS